VGIPKAAEMLAVSRSTIQRLVREGRLEVAGQGRLRRVTTRSINAYLEQESSWQKNGGGAKGRAASSRTKTGSGGPGSKSKPGNGAGHVRLVGKTPKPK
jgi:excisionase family DNA binding protein